MYPILACLDFYKNNKCVIRKILISTDKLGIRWYNDVTIYIKKPILFIVLKIREEWVDNSIAESHIFSTETNRAYTIEIFTLNEINELPNLISKEKLYERLLGELLQDF